MRRLIAVAAVAALASCGSAPTPSGVSVHVDANPFRVTILRDGKTVVSEDSGARLRFEVAPANDEYSLTQCPLRARRQLPGRRRPSRAGRRRSRSPDDDRRARSTVALHPAADVTEVYDAFDTTPERALPRRRRARRSWSTCAGQILPVEVNDQCSYAPIPFFASSAGWGLRLASRARAALAFPGSPGRRGAASPSDAADLQLPAARGPGRGLRPGADARRAPLRRLVRPDARRLRGRDRPAAGAAALRARADQVA